MQERGRGRIGLPPRLAGSADINQSRTCDSAVRSDLRPPRFTGSSMRKGKLYPHARVPPCREHLLVSRGVCYLPQPSLAKPLPSRPSRRPVSLCCSVIKRVVSRWGGGGSNFVTYANLRHFIFNTILLPGVCHCSGIMVRVVSLSRLE